MDIPTLKISDYDARQAVRHYAAAVKERHSDEYLALLRGYKAILRGKRVIDLNAAVTGAGTDTLGRPKLAAARADCQWCTVRRVNGPAVRFFSTRRQSDRTSNAVRGHVARITIRGFTGVLLNFEQDYRAMTPLVPPQHSPGGHRLKEYVVLFEAEWERAPTDPILLRPLGGPLYAVVAQWDLSPLERAVLYDARMKA